MPVKSMDNMKGTSPSKLVQRGVDQSWGQQQNGGEDGPARAGAACRDRYGADY